VDELQRLNTESPDSPEIEKVERQVAAGDFLQTMMSYDVDEESLDGLDENREFTLYETVAIKISELLAAYMASNVNMLPSEETEFFTRTEGDEVEGAAADESGPIVPEASEDPNREAIASKATFYLGSTAFQDPNLMDGKLAGPLFVSTVLQETGVLPESCPTITEVKVGLLRAGWTMHYGTPKRGDVVVWNRVRHAREDGKVELGHKHMGVSVGNGRVVSQSPTERVPIEHDAGRDPSTDTVWARRGIEMVLSPPKA